MMNHATFKASLFMAAGIIDHETGTRDMRRLDGLFKAMPITGTLAMVASAAMAGVPLLNGFLSKEMFFAETVFISSLPWVEMEPAAGRHAWRACSRWPIRCASVMTSSSARRCRQTCRASRTSRRAGCACRSSCWCSPAWSSASRRHGRSDRRSTRPRGRWSAATLPPYSLAVWHGFNAPLVMSLVAMAGGVALYVALRRQLQARRVPQHAAGCIASTARRRSSARSRRAARSRAAALRLLGTARLQPQMFAIVLLARGWPRSPRCGLAACSGATGRACRPSPEFVLLWSIGMRVRGGRRLAGQVPSAGRADDAGGRRPRHLPDLRLVLGARPRADAARRRGRDHRAVPARPALAAQAHRAPDDPRTPRPRAVATLARLRARRAGRRRPGRARLRDADAAGAAKHLAVLPRARVARRRRHQRRQRDAGRLPRLRHARRDHACSASSR